MSHYLITGGTGLIGSALCQQLLANQHVVTVLSRQVEKVAKQCGSQARAITALDEINADDKIDIVVNLAGAPIADKRWSKARKHELEQSRIAFTSRLVDWMSRRPIKPACLISGSAVGWYGDGGSAVLTENSDCQDEYTHQLCAAWEQQALRAQEQGIRVCIVRTGLVLAAAGGFLAKMLLPFKMGLGGRLGSGQQYMPWIHLTDIVNMLQFLAEQEQCQGLFNGCAPMPVTNHAFTLALAKQLHRPSVLPLPAWLLQLLLGEMSRLLLTGQRAMPEKVQAFDFKFIYTDLSVALNDVLS